MICRLSKQLQAIHHAFRTMEKKKRFHHVDAECLMRRQQASLDNLKSDNFALQQIVDTYIITVIYIHAKQNLLSS